ncbi:hypothetical protein GCK32_022797, partial [Trichostrongylus colubriformis]
MQASSIRREENAVRQRRRREAQSVEERASRQAKNVLRQRRRREAESAEGRASRQAENVLRLRRRRKAQSAEERASRQTENVVRQSRRREAQSAEERASRQAENALRQRRRRDRGSLEERSVRTAENAQRQRRRREVESIEDRSVRLTEAAERRRQRRQSENVQERTARRLQDAERHSIRRVMGTVEEGSVHRNSEGSLKRPVRLESNAERSLQRRREFTESIGVALRTRTSESHYLGGLDRRYVHCGARHFVCEVKPNHPDTFVECCDLGKIRLNMFVNFPESLRELYVQRADSTVEQRRVQRNFLENIRNFNSALAMASMGAQVDVLRGRGPYCYRIY